MKKKKIPPPHPGDILNEEFLKPLGLSQNRLGNEIGVPPRRINEIVHHKRGISADTALRLARYFKMTPEFWMGLQMGYDLEIEKDRIAGQLERRVKVYSAA
jgi:addiction module HigA family antidote